MKQGAQREYRNGLAVVRGDRPRGWRHMEARRQLDRDTHGLVLKADAAKVPVQFADWWYDLRRGQLRIYGGLLRFIDLSCELGVPKDALLNIPRWIESYIHDLYDDPRRRIKRVA